MDIWSELDNMGGISNAFTSFEYTGYYAKVRPNHLENALDLLSDIYINQLFDPGEIEREKGVIIEEINMTNDDPPRKVWDEFINLLYGDQPAGWDIAGPKENIKKMTREDLIKYHDANYVAESTLVVIAGKFDELKIIEDVKKYFANISRNLKAGKVKVAEHQEKPEVRVIFKETDQTHLIMGIRAFDIFDERKYALEVLADILGGGFSSRLFQKIRVQMSAAYYVGSDASLFTDHGFLGISAGLDNQKVDDVLRVILEELERLVRELVTEEELKRAKEHLTGQLILSLETSNQLAGFFGSQEILEHKIITPEELVAKIQAVTSEQIKEVAKEIMENKNLNLALIGPFKEKERFEKILKL